MSVFERVTRFFKAFDNVQQHQGCVAEHAGGPLVGIEDSRNLGMLNCQLLLIARVDYFAGDEDPTLDDLRICLTFHEAAKELTGCRRDNAHTTPPIQGEFGMGIQSETQWNRWLWLRLQIRFSCVTTSKVSVCVRGTKSECSGSLIPK